MLKSLINNAKFTLSSYNPIVQFDHKKNQSITSQSLQFSFDAFFPFIYWILVYPSITHNTFNRYLQFFELALFLIYGLKLFKSINLLVYANSLKNKNLTLEKRNDQIRSIEYSNTLFNSNMISVVFYVGIIHFLCLNLTINSLIFSTITFVPIVGLAIFNYFFYLNQILIKSKILHTVSCLSFVVASVIFPSYSILFLVSLLFNLIYLNDIRKKIGKLNYNLIQTSVICNLCLLCTQLNLL